MECKSLKTGIFGIGEINYPDWSWIMATQITDIPFGLVFWGGFKKKRASY